MNKQEFDEKYVGKYIVVHCKTEELAIEFLNLADSFGYKWKVSGSYVKDSKYDMYRNKTCYDISLGEYCTVNHANEYGYKVIEFKSEKQQPKPLLHKMIDLFMEEWELEFDEVFKASWSNGSLYKIDKDYKLYNRYVTVDRDVFFEIDNRTFVHLVHIVKLPKKVKYTLEIEQEEITDCSKCKFVIDSSVKVCFITHDLIGNYSIPSNCPLKKVEV